MKITRVLMAAACVALAGCSGDGIERPPGVNVAFFNAAPGYDLLCLDREGLQEASLQFGSGGIRQAPFDSGVYEFHVEHQPAGSPPTCRTRLFSASHDLVPGNDYLFIITNPVDAIDLLVVPTPTTAIGTAIARFALTHANPKAGALDAYLAPAGADLTTLSPNGTVSYGPTANAMDVPPGSYHLYLTPAGDPGTVVFESADLPAAAGVITQLIVSDTGGQGFVDYEVFRVSNITNQIARVLRVDVGSRLRVIQAIDDRMDRDILLDGTTTPPFFSALPFGELSAEQALDGGLHDLSLTPVGTPGTIEAAVTYAAGQGLIQTAVASGNSTDGISLGVFVEDRRRITGQGTLSVIHAAGMFSFVQLYVYPPGTDITTVSPSFGLSFPPTITNRLPVAPGDYEVTITNPLTATVLAGPIPLTIADGGLYGLTLTNGVGGSTIDVGYFYDLAP